MVEGPVLAEGYVPGPVKAGPLVKNKNENKNENETNWCLVFYRDFLVEWVKKHSIWVGKYQVGVPISVAREFVEAACRTKYPFLVLSIIWRESGFNPYDVSKKNAIGAAQIAPVHWKELQEVGIISEPAELFLPEKAARHDSPY